MITLHDQRVNIYGTGETLELAIDDLRRAFHSHYSLLLRTPELTPYLNDVKEYLKIALEHEVEVCVECGNTFHSLPDDHEQRVKTEFEREIRKQRRLTDYHQHLEHDHDYHFTAGDCVA